MHLSALADALRTLSANDRWRLAALLAGDQSNSDGEYVPPQLADVNPCALARKEIC